LTVLRRTMAVLLAAVIIGIVSFFVLLQGRLPSPDGDATHAASDVAPEEMPLPVKTAMAKRGSLIVKLRFPGEAIAPRKVTLEAEVPGVVDRLNVREGQYVRRGELLAWIRDTEYRLELERAEAERLRVLSEFVLDSKFSGSKGMQSKSHRAESSSVREDLPDIGEKGKSGVISKQEFERRRKHHEVARIESGEKKEEVMAAVKGLTQAEIDVKRAQMNLEKTNIKAPFAGVICDIRISPQEYVTSRRALFTLIDLSLLKVLVKVLESEMGRIRVGQDADIRFSAYPDRMFRGKVETISPLVNSEERTCRAVLKLLDPEQTIKPGMHADVEIVTEIHRDRLLIPQEAVLIRGGRSLVFVVESNLAKWRHIQTGRENRHYVEVLERGEGGIREGEFVIVDGHFTLAHDTRVCAVD
jgi:RND family efflux transporter MFP subunit